MNVFFILFQMLKCTKCSFKGDQHCMLNHIVEKHRSTANASYWCQLCNNKYVSKKQLKQHACHIHGGDYDYCTLHPTEYNEPEPETLRALLAKDPNLLMKLKQDKTWTKPSTSKFPLYYLDESDSDDDNW